MHDLDTVAAAAVTSLHNATRSAQQRAIGTRPTVRQPRLVMAATLVTLTLATVGLATWPRHQQPPAEPGTATAPAPANDLQLGFASGTTSLPADLRLSDVTENAFDGLDLLTDNYVVRMYTTDPLRPETAPALVVRSVPESTGGSELTLDGEPITVQDASGVIAPNAFDSWTVELGPLNGHVFRLTGHHLTRDQLVAAAETVHVADPEAGATVDLSVLPPGMIERAAGGVLELSFIAEAALTVPAPLVHYAGPNDRSLWYLVMRQDPSLTPLGRLLYDQVADANIRGLPGYLATSTLDPAFTGLVWADGDRTILVGSRNLSTDELTAAANDLRPIADDAWQALSAAAERTTPQTPDDTTTTILTADAGNPEATTKFRQPSHTVRVLVVNAAGVPGIAGNLTASLPDGYDTAVPTNATIDPNAPLTQSQVLYRPGFEADARTLADDLGGTTIGPILDSIPVNPDELGFAAPDLVVLLGTDNTDGWPIPNWPPTN